MSRPGHRRAQRERQVEVTGYVSRSMKDRVKAHAAREGRSESDLVGAALRAYFFRGSRCDFAAAPTSAASCTPTSTPVSSPSPRERFAAAGAALFAAVQPGPRRRRRGRRAS